MNDLFLTRTDKNWQIFIVRLTFQAPGKLRAAHLQRSLLLPVLQVPAGPVTDQQLGHLGPLLLHGGVECGVAVPVRAVHDGVVISQEESHHTSLPWPTGSVTWRQHSKLFFLAFKWSKKDACVQIIFFTFFYPPSLLPYQPK